jgi:hypothetical protein
MTTFDNFRSKYIGQRVDYDKIFQYQCVDLIRQYFYECFDFPGGGGVPSAITYWTGTPNDVLGKFIRVGSSDAQKGDVVILWGLAGNEHGHIGIATGQQTGTQVEILEQNGYTGNGSGEGGDAIRTRFIDKSRIAGLLRPITAAATPPFTVVDRFPSRIFIANKQPSLKYDITQQSFEAVRDHVVHTFNGGDKVAATVRVRHTNGYEYYGNDNDPGGYNVFDWDIYTEPVPYNPPAPKYEAPPAEKYTVVTRLMGFATSEEARTHQNVQRDIEPGDYFVFSKVDKCYNVSDSNVHDRSWWINTVDNVIVPAPVVTEPVDIVPPVFEPVDVVNPEAVKLQFQMIPPIELEAINAIPQLFPDLEGKTAVKAQLNPGSIKEYSMMTFVGDEEYYIPTLSMKRGWRHGIPRDLLDYPQAQTYGPFDRDKDGDVDIWDFIDYGSKLFGTTKNTIYKVASNPKLTEAKSRITKAVDGFSRKKGN